jgi:cytochrome c-type biogenesis protein CcmH/NrfG
MFLATGAATRMISSSVAAWTVPATGVRAPFRMFVAVRAMAPVAGMPPNRAAWRFTWRDAAIFREAIRHNPEWIDSYLMLAEIFLRLGGRSEALKVLRQAELLEKPRAGRGAVR